MTAVAPRPRVDARDKVMGAVRYGTDRLPEGLTHAAMAVATVGKGTILEIDTAAAEAVPGVLLVLTRIDESELKAPGYIMAGGHASVFRSREGAEDDARAGARAVRARARAGDVVVGVSASGVTPFVRGGLAAARRAGARTVIVTCSRARGVSANVVIAPAPGPEVLAGSTRLKAGTATKLVLNTLTTASMARLGKIYGNRMVDVQPHSRKLRARAARLVAEIGGVSPARARRLLAAARSRVPVAIVMARKHLSAEAAARALRVAGSLRPVIERDGGQARFTRR